MARDKMVQEVRKAIPDPVGDPDLDESFLREAGKASARSVVGKMMQGMRSKLGL